MKFKLVLLFVCFYSSTIAQYFQWADLVPGLGNYHQTCMAIDEKGNSYVSGYFQNTVDFDPDTGVFMLTSIPSGDDIFLAKYDADGKFKWANRFGNSSNDQGISVKVDHAGNILLAAIFQSTSDFDPGPNVSNVSSVGGYDFVIAKYDSLGTYIWAKPFGGVDNELKIQIDVDAANNVYSVGVFSSMVDLDPSPTSAFNITSAFADDIFISKLDSNGNFIWAKSITGTTGPEEANAMDVLENGTIYFTGRADGGLGTDWDPGPAVYNLPYSIWDPYVSEFDSAGNFLWVKQFNVPGLQTGIAYALKCDDSGNVFTAGQFKDSIDLNPDTAVACTINSAGLWDTYISKLDSTGNFVWGKSIGGSAGDYAYALTLDKAANVYLTGQFSSICDFNPDMNLVYNIQSNGFNSPDMYTLKLDSSGIFQWAFNIGGIYTDEGNAIAVDNQDNIFINGKFGGLVDFNPDTNAAYNLSSSTYYTLFLMKLNQCTPQFITLNQTACDSFIYNGSTYFASGVYQHLFTDINGCDSTVTLSLNIANNDTAIYAWACESYFYNGQTYDTSGIYYHSFTNIFGCDSVVTLDLSVVTIDTMLTQIGTLLMTNLLPGATYQWIDCISGAWIPLQDNYSYIPLTPGSYGVIINYNGCSDTSECIYVTNVGQDEINNESELSIFPNPNSGIFDIKFNKAFPGCSIEIYNNMGQLILNNDLKNQIDLRNHPDGLYFLKVKMSDERFSIIKVQKSE